MFSHLYKSASRTSAGSVQTPDPLRMRMERNNRLYPKHPASLSRRLNSIASSLKLAGITFQIKPDGVCKRIYIKNHKAKKRSIVGGGLKNERK